MTNYAMKPGVKWWINMNVEQIEAARAVIEAAKAYVQQREERPLDPEHVRQALYFDLAETVEALQEVEGE